MKLQKRIGNILAIAAVIALAGCASSPVPTTYYLLRGEPDIGTGQVDADVRVGIGRVVVAPYLLAAKGIMVETGEGEITPAFHHQWAEPIDVALRWYLRAEIGDALGHKVGGGLTDRLSWDYTVDVIISRLHSTMSGTALIEAQFVVVPRDPEQQTTQTRFVKAIPLPTEGYPGVVAAEKALAYELAGLIADALREQTGP
jgi:uncharacterized lipoprotein YmbA